MENNQELKVTEVDEVDEIAKPKKSIRAKVYLVLFVIILGLGLYGYYWIRTTNNLRVEAQAVVTKAEGYDALRGAIQKEADRCKTFITQSQGNFASFEYCKGFIDWEKGMAKE